MEGSNEGILADMREKCHTFAEFQVLISLCHASVACVFFWGGIWEERPEQCTFTLEDLAGGCGTDGSIALCECFVSGVPKGMRKRGVRCGYEPWGRLEDWKTPLAFFLQN